MKRFSFIVIVVLLCSLLFIAGCSNNNSGNKNGDNNNPGPQTDPNAPVAYTEAQIYELLNSIDKTVDGNIDISVNSYFGNESTSMQHYLYAKTANGDLTMIDDGYSPVYYANIEGVPYKITYSRGTGIVQNIIRTSPTAGKEAFTEELADYIVDEASFKQIISEAQSMVTAMYGADKFKYELSGSHTTYDGVTSSEISLKFNSVEEDVHALLNITYTVTLRGNRLTMLSYAQEYDTATLSPIQAMRAPKISSMVNFVYGSDTLTNLPDVSDAPDITPKNCNVYIYGSSISDTIDLNTDYTLPAYPELPSELDIDYNVDGYFYDSDYLEKAGVPGDEINVGYEGSISLYMKLVPKTPVVVSFNMAHGKIEPITLASGQTYQALNLSDIDYKVDGPYFVDGYFLDAGFETSAEDSITAITADTTIYVRTTEFNKLTLSAEGAEQLLPTIFITEAYMTLPEVTKAGKYFVGWYKDAACTQVVSYSDGRHAMPEESATYYAKFEDGCTITFEHGSYTTTAPKSLTIKKGGELSYLNNILDLVASKYTVTEKAFQGWTPAISVYPTADVTLAPKFINDVTFNFVINDAGVTMQGGIDGASISILQGRGYLTAESFVDALIDPEEGLFTGLDGYKHVIGVYTDANYTQEFTTWPSVNTTLYVKLTIDKVVAFEVGENANLNTKYALIDNAKTAYPNFSDFLDSVATQITPPEEKDVEGFYTNKELTTAVSRNSWPTEATIIYVKYKAAVTITVNAAPGTYQGELSATDYVRNHINTYNNFKEYIDYSIVSAIMTPDQKLIEGLYTDANFTTPLVTTAWPTSSINIYVKYKDKISVYWSMDNLGWNTDSVRTHVDGLKQIYDTFAECLADYRSMLYLTNLFDGFYTDENLTVPLDTTAWPTSSINVYFKTATFPTITLNYGDYTYNDPNDNWTPKSVLEINFAEAGPSSRYLRAALLSAMQAYSVNNVPAGKIVSFFYDAELTDEVSCSDEITKGNKTIYVGPIDEIIITVDLGYEHVDSEGYATDAEGTRLVDGNGTAITAKLELALNDFLLNYGDNSFYSKLKDELNWKTYPEGGDYAKKLFIGTNEITATSAYPEESVTVTIEYGIYPRITVEFEEGFYAKKQGFEEELTTVVLTADNLNERYLRTSVFDKFMQEYSLYDADDAQISGGFEVAVNGDVIDSTYELDGNITVTLIAPSIQK